MPRIETGLHLLTMVDTETQTPWPADNGLLGKPLVCLSPNGECYHTVEACYALRNTRMPHRLCSCAFCCCANPVLKSRRR